MNAAERRAVAYHELGHALVALALPGAKVQKVSIVPRGITALGYTIQHPTEDRFLMSRAELADKMTVLLGERVGESLALGEISTGAADDLAKATAIARSMVLLYGMVPELGLVRLWQQHTDSARCASRCVGTAHVWRADCRRHR